MTERTPHFLCIGATRCGTTSLWNWLNQHPSVHLSPIKETNYFARDLIRREGPCDRETIPDIVLPDLARISSAHTGIIWDEATYLAALSGLENQCCGEISPSYLFYATQVAPRIYTFNPDCKIIVLLREPVSRALSQYAIFSAAGREPLSFHEAIREETFRLERGSDYGRAYKSLGLYYESMRTYLRTFGPDQVWVGLYDDLLAYPQMTFDNICQFLNIPLHPIDGGIKVHQSPLSVGPLLRFARTKPGNIITRLTPSPVRRWLRLQDRRMKLATEKHRQKDIRLLHKFYSSDIAKLDQLLPTLGIKKRWDY